jgi:hypothetical protein
VIAENTTFENSFSRPTLSGSQITCACQRRVDSAINAQLTGARFPQEWRSGAAARRLHRRTGATSVTARHRAYEHSDVIRPQVSGTIS